MIVAKAVKMAEMMNIKILGIIENMSYVECPDCKTKIYPFGKSKLEEVAAEYSIPVLGRLPMTPELSELTDKGEIENVGNYLQDAMNVILG